MGKKFFFGALVLVAFHSVGCGSHNSDQAKAVLTAKSLGGHGPKVLVSPEEQARLAVIFDADVHGQWISTCQKTKSGSTSTVLKIDDASSGMLTVINYGASGCAGSIKDYQARPFKYAITSSNATNTIFGVEIEYNDSDEKQLSSLDTVFTIGSPSDAAAVSYKVRTYTQRLNGVDVEKVGANTSVTLGRIQEAPSEGLAPEQPAPDLTIPSTDPAEVPADPIKDPAKDAAKE